MTRNARENARKAAVLGGLAVVGGWPLTRPEESLWVPRVTVNARPRSHWSRPDLHDMRLVGTELGLPLCLDCPSHGVVSISIKRSGPLLLPRTYGDLGCYRYSAEIGDSLASWAA